MSDWTNYVKTMQRTFFIFYLLIKSLGFKNPVWVTQSIFYKMPVFSHFYCRPFSKMKCSFEINLGLFVFIPQETSNIPKDSCFFHFNLDIAWAYIPKEKHKFFVYSQWN